MSSLADRFGPAVRVRLELADLQLHLQDAMLRQQDVLKGMIDEAIKREVTSDNIKRIIDSQARELVGRTVRDEMESFFRYGKGRKAIHEHVIKLIEKEMTNEGA